MASGIISGKKLRTKVPADDSATCSLRFQPQQAAIPLVSTAQVWKASELRKTLLADADRCGNGSCGQRPGNLRVAEEIPTSDHRLC
jgi:hypothetical protein